MKFDHNNDFFYFKRRYEQIEKEFLELTDFIPLQSDFYSPCYKFGSSKLMDFCLKIGTEIETLFRIILETNTFDQISNIDTKRKNQSIKVYQKIIEPHYNLRNYRLFVNSIHKVIYPFEKFNSKVPNWFRVYSKHKHNKIELIKRWNLKYALFSLGALLVLIFNHPTKPAIYQIRYIKTEVFNLPNANDRFYLNSLYNL